MPIFARRKKLMSRLCIQCEWIVNRLAIGKILCKTFSLQLSTLPLQPDYPEHPVCQWQSGTPLQSRMNRCPLPFLLLESDLPFHRLNQKCCLVCWVRIPTRHWETDVAFHALTCGSAWTSRVNWTICCHFELTWVNWLGLQKKTSFKVRFTILKTVLSKS